VAWRSSQTTFIISSSCPVRVRLGVLIRKQ
jgi:hypothetical protein